MDRKQVDLILYTSYFANYKNVSPDIQCVSIANSKPSSIVIPKWAEVVPNWTYVQYFKNGQISFELFSSMYLNYLINLRYSYDFMNYLEHFKSDVCLLCYEKEINQCHRKILAEFLVRFFNVNYLGEI